MLFALLSYRTVLLVQLDKTVVFIQPDGSNGPPSGSSLDRPNAVGPGTSSDAKLVAFCAVLTGRLFPAFETVAVRCECLVLQQRF